MKWVRVADDGGARYGVLDGETIRLTSDTWDDLLNGVTPTYLDDVAAESATLLNPVPAPGKIVAIGLNYLDHCRETGMEVPKSPLVFTKFNTSLVGPDDEIVWSASLTQKVDYEAELAVVMGKTARNVDVDDALAYVFGYTAANDVSARDIQLGDGQWVRGKSLDTFCPVGPAVVTADEIPDPGALAIRSILNGKVMQDSNTSELIFGVAELIAFCSRSFTLEPGDLILTGTPFGVALGRQPEVYMQDSDEIVVEIEGIGRLVNTCRVVA